MTLINRPSSDKTLNDGIVVFLRIVGLVVIIWASVITKSSSNSAWLAMLAIGWGLWTMIRTIAYFNEKKRDKKLKEK